MKILLVGLVWTYFIESFFKGIGHKFSNLFRPLLLVLKVDWFSLQPCTAYCYIHVFSLFYSELHEFNWFSLSRLVRGTAIFMSVVYFTTNFFSLTGSLSPGLCGVLLHHHPLSPVLPVTATALPAVWPVCSSQPVLQSGCVVFFFLLTLLQQVWCR